MDIGQQFSFKDLEDVVIKTTSDIEIDGKLVKKNETIAVFDTLQLASFGSSQGTITAHGGYMDLDHVW